MEKNNIQNQIDNLKTQTVLLEKLLKINTKYENTYGHITSECVSNVKASDTLDNQEKNKYSSMFYRRIIC